MKLERLQEYVLPVVATLAGMGFAVYVGYLMGQGQVSTVAALLGVLFLGFLTMVMRQYIWLLLIFAWPWTGQIPLIPGPFGVRDLAVMAVTASFLTLKALKVARRKPTYEIADLLLGLMLCYLVTVFIRNPVGTLFTNSSRVGGRPYFAVFITGLAYWILSRASVAGKAGANTVILASMVSVYSMGILNVLSDVSAKAAQVLANIYAGLAGTPDPTATAAMLPSDVDPAAIRLTYLAPVGVSTNLALISFFTPLTLLKPHYPLRMAFFGFGVFVCLLTGFRTSIILTLGWMMLGTYLRSGWLDVVRLAIIGLGCLVVLVAGNGRLYHLPFPAQRALSFLPGKWDAAAAESARDSSEWRFQIWREMLKSNKYIRNRLLGDGFGFLKRDLEAIAWLQWTRTGDDQESTMIVGNFHSGPISTIRITGYVGLVIYLALLITIARMAWRLARRASNTWLQPLALFVCLPPIFEPFFFVFVFGGFDSSLPNTMFALGMLKLLANSLDDFERDRPLERTILPARKAAPEYALSAGSQ